MFFDVREQHNYRSMSPELLTPLLPYVVSQDRLLSGRSQVQLLSGAPNAPRSICKSATKSVIPAVIGWHGTRLILVVRHRGKPRLQYLTDGQIREHPPGMSLESDSAR
jgi:hypothetical protein